MYKTFNLNSDTLKEEIILLKCTVNIPKGEKNKCGDCMNHAILVNRKVLEN